MALEPAYVGADQVTRARSSPGTAEALTGTPGGIGVGVGPGPGAGPGEGGARGVTALEAAEVVPHRSDAFMAFTVKVYAVPLVRPPTMQVVAGACALHVRPPGLAVTWYHAIAEVPVHVGAAHDTETCS